MEGVVGRRKGGRKRPRLPPVEGLEWEERIYNEEDSSQFYSARQKLQKLGKLFKGQRQKLFN